MAAIDLIVLGIGLSLRCRNDWLAAPGIAAIEASDGVMLPGPAATAEARRMPLFGETLGAFMLFFGVFALATVACFWRNEQRWRAGQGLGRGYSLAGLSVSRCPERGRPFRPEELDSTL